MIGRLDLSSIWQQARRRVADGWPPVALAAVASALAWPIAHNLLGHRQPFFAPIAAAIALSTSRIQRSRRIAQMVAGVVLGIAVGEALTTLLGSNAATVGVVVFVTMTLALLSRIGFFGEGLMFANQAAASAILVTTLHRPGAGPERIEDALVGGGVAFVLGVVLFPAEPMAILRQAERSVLEGIAHVLDQAASAAAGPGADDGWVLRANHELHGRLAALARARATARANVRVAPRRWRLRRTVDDEEDRVAGLDLVATTVLGLARAAIDAAELSPALAEDRRESIGALAQAIRALAIGREPWPGEDAAAVCEALPRGPETMLSAHRAAVLEWALRTTVADLLAVIEPSAARAPHDPAQTG